MKLLIENWRKFLDEMSFKRDTKTVVGFDFDHTMARTAGGQVAYFDPERKWRIPPTKKKPVQAGINPKYFETHEKVPEESAAKAELSDSQIAKLLSLAKKNPDKARKLVIKYMRCDGSRSEPFWCPSQAQLDFYTQADQWKGLWQKDPSQRPDCWAFDFSSRDILGWENGTPEKSQQVPVMKAFRKAATTPGVEIIILTSRSSAVEPQIPNFLKDVGAPQIEQAHIKGCQGCDKGEFLYSEVLVNEKDYDIGNLYFYDDSEANIATVSQYIKKAVDEGLIEGEGIVYRVDKHNGSFSVAHRFAPEQTSDDAGEEPDETPL